MWKKALAVAMMVFSGWSFAAPVDVNKADQAQLETVKGIGPATAGKILAERKKGSFKDWGDLVGRVPGIGDKSAQKLSDGGLVIDGKAYKLAKAGDAAKADAKQEAKPAPGAKPAQGPVPPKK